MKTPYYPISIKVEGRKCVVVGGGQVALRKVRTLLDHGASVEVVSADLCAELAGLAESGQVQAVRRDYQSGDVAGAFIAIAATDDRGANQKISKEAGQAGVLVNVVDDAAISDFIVPSYLCRGDVVIAVSTGGKSPALARKIRASLEVYFGEEYAALVDLVEEVRAELKRRGAEFVLEPVVRRPGLKISFIRGPENTRIELLERS